MSTAPSGIGRCGHRLGGRVLACGGILVHGSADGTRNRGADCYSSSDADDTAQAGPLLEQIDKTVASFTGDGTYDHEGVHDAVAQRHPDAAVIVPQLWISLDLLVCEQ